MIDLAKELGCRGMLDVTEPDNEAAIATYRRARRRRCLSVCDIRLDVLVFAPHGPNNTIRNV